MRKKKEVLFLEVNLQLYSYVAMATLAIYIYNHQILVVKKPRHNSFLQKIVRALSYA